MALRRNFCPGILVLSLGLWGGAAATMSVALGQQSGEEVALPRPQRVGGMSLAKAISGRRSVREFPRQLLSWEQVGE